MPLPSPLILFYGIINFTCICFRLTWHLKLKRKGIRFCKWQHSPDTKHLWSQFPRWSGMVPGGTAYYINGTFCRYFRHWKVVIRLLRKKPKRPPTAISDTRNEVEQVETRYQYQSKRNNRPFCIKCLLTHFRNMCAKLFVNGFRNTCKMKTKYFRVFIINSRACVLYCYMKCRKNTGR